MQVNELCARKTGRKIDNLAGLGHDPDFRTAFPKIIAFQDGEDAPVTPHAQCLQ